MTPAGICTTSHGPLPADGDSARPTRLARDRRIAASFADATTSGGPLPRGPRGSLLRPRRRSRLRPGRRRSGDRPSAVVPHRRGAFARRPGLPAPQRSRDQGRPAAQAAVVLRAGLHRLRPRLRDRLPVRRLLRRERRGLLRLDAGRARGGRLLLGRLEMDRPGDGGLRRAADRCGPAVPDDQARTRPQAVRLVRLAGRARAGGIRGPRAHGPELAAADPVSGLGAAVVRGVPETGGGLARAALRPGVAGLRGAVSGARPGRPVRSRSSNRCGRPA